MPQLHAQMVRLHIPAKDISVSVFFSKEKGSMGHKAV